MYVYDIDFLDTNDNIVAHRTMTAPSKEDVIALAKRVHKQETGEEINNFRIVCTGFWD